MSSNDVEHTDGAEVAAAEAGIISPVMRTTTGMWGSDSGPSDTSVSYTHLTLPTSDLV